MPVHRLYLSCLWFVVRNRICEGNVPLVISERINILRLLWEEFEIRKSSYGNYHSQLTRLCEISQLMNDCCKCGLFHDCMEGETQCESHYQMMSSALEAQRVYKKEFEASSSRYRLHVRKCEVGFPELLSLVKRKIERDFQFEVEMWWQI